MTHQYQIPIVAKCWIADYMTEHGYDRGGYCVEKKCDGRSLTLFETKRNGHWLIVSYDDWMILVFAHTDNCDIDDFRTFSLLKIPEAEDSDDEDEDEVEFSDTLDTEEEDELEVLDPANYLADYEFFDDEDEEDELFEEDEDQDIEIEYDDDLECSDQDLDEDSDEEPDDQEEPIDQTEDKDIEIGYDDYLENYYGKKFKDRVDVQDIKIEYDEDCKDR